MIVFSIQYFMLQIDVAVFIGSAFLCSMQVLGNNDAAFCSINEVDKSIEVEKTEFTLLASVYLEWAMVPLELSDALLCSTLLPITRPYVHIEKLFIKWLELMFQT